MSKDLVCKKEIKCSNIIKQYKMFNFDYTSKEDINKHNRNWKQFPDHLNKMLIVRGSASGKTRIA